MRNIRATLAFLIALGLMCAATPVLEASAAPGAARSKPSVEVAPVAAEAPSQVPGGRGLFSLDFKDAEVVNVLRLLHAESGRNIVMGPDVKGKISLSLRNVTWEQALDSVLEAGGLARTDKGGIIRIVTIDQLTREREAQLRAEEAQRKAELEVRTRLAEAQLKEADVAARKAAQDAAVAEAAARGPLREETIRLSYADPEEVVKTLQGILGIPPEGMPVSGMPTGASPAGAPLIAEPPFAQLYGVGTGVPPLRLRWCPSPPTCSPRD